MKSRILSRALCLGMATAFALPVAGIAVAQETLETVHVTAPAGVKPIALLSSATGLTERQVKMVLGNRSAYAEYQTEYDAADRSLRKALGPEIYQRVKFRHELSPQDVQKLTAMANAHNGR